LDGITCTNNTRCTGPGNHEAGDSQCTCTPSPDTCDPPGSTSCELNHVYVYNGCSGGTGGDDGTGDGTDPSGGETGGGNPPNDDDGEPDDNGGTIAIPFDNYKYFKDNCISLKKLSQTDEFSANINP